MKKLIVSLTISVALAPPLLMGQDTVNLPPDIYGDALREGYAAWQNTGWVRNTAGNPEGDIEYVTDGAHLRAFIKKYGAMSLVLSSIDTSIATLDTLRRLDVDFDGELAQFPNPIAKEQLGYHKNFHLPWCGPGGKTEVQGYKWMVYPNLYPYIDMYIYCGQRGQKIMFVIRPGGNPANLQMRFSGQDEMDIDVLGNLRMLLQERWVVLPEAVAYQYDTNNDISPVDWIAEYTANTNTGNVGFTFGEYDTTQTLALLIGPPPMQGGPSVFTEGICWSTFYGGDGEDVIRSSCVDGSGNYYVAGQTFSTETTFPVEAGQVIVAVSPAVTIAQFDSNDNLIWSTLFGATDGEQIAYGVDVPSIGGGVYICGRMEGDDIAVPDNPPSGPYTNTTAAFGAQGFLASFNATVGELQWSTYFGGASSAVFDLDFDAIGNLFICGQMEDDLPLPTEVTPDPSAADWDNSGGLDAFVSKLNQNLKVAWSTYIGGDSWDVAWSIRLGAGGVVVAGDTYSDDDLQTLTAGGSQAHNFSATTYGRDIFIEEFSSVGIHLWGSYLSYGGYMGYKGLAVDRNNGDIFLAGWFPYSNTTMPVSTSAPWYQEAISNNSQKSFIWQIGSDHVRKYSTFINGGGGASGSNELYAITILNDGYFFAAGTAWGTGIPTFAATGLYSEDTRLGMADGFIIAFSPWHDRAWCTYFGGNLDYGSHPERIMTLVPKWTDRLYAAGYTSSPYDEDLDRFYPLHDALGGAWWDSFLELTNGGSDGFTAAFCIDDNLVGTPNMSEQDQPLMCLAKPGLLDILGLEPGTHEVTLVDAAGRTILRERILSSAAKIATIRLGPLADGIYVLSTSEQSARVAIQH